MNVLITNDDGYGAWGIEALIKSLSKKHNVFVLAPDGNRSGFSHHINFGTKLILTKVSDNHFVTTGTPADCVFTALQTDVFSQKIDVVVSGINKGANIGTDIIYSGTCGAAREAVIQGVPGIAVSMQLPTDNLEWDDVNNWHFDSLSDFVCNNLEQLALLAVTSDKGRAKEQKCVYVNVNAYSYTSFTGVVFTEPCFREYLNDRVYFNKIDGTNDKYENILEFGKSESKSRGYSDIQACEERKISISRIYAEPVETIDSSLDSIKFSL